MDFYFEFKRDEATGGWRKLRNEELHNLLYSLHISRMIKSKKMGLPGHIARTKDKRNI
jgi:hypothetical protein